MRLIDADALYEFITKRYSDLKGGSYPFNYVAFDMARLVEKAPTIDAVEVVRCKDCIYWTGGDYCANCIAHGLNTRYANEYCSRGKRREG